MAGLLLLVDGAKNAKNVNAANTDAVREAEQLYRSVLADAESNAAKYAIVLGSSSIVTRSLSFIQIRSVDRSQRLHCVHALANAVLSRRTPPPPDRDAVRVDAAQVPNMIEFTLHFEMLCFV